MSTRHITALRNSSNVVSVTSAVSAAVRLSRRRATQLNVMATSARAASAEGSLEVYSVTSPPVILEMEAIHQASMGGL